MTEQQEKLVSILVQFHNICEEIGAKYYLIGDQLLFAAQNNSIHGYEVSVAMFDFDWTCLQNALPKMDNIEIESVDDSGNMPGCYLRYVDKNSLLLDLDYYGVYSKPGIALNIYIIRSDRIKTRFLSYIENLMSFQAKHPRNVRTKIYNLFVSIVQNTRYTGWLSKMEKTVRAKTSDNRTILKEAYGNMCSFPPGFWNKRTMVSFMGYSLYTVAQYKKYLTKRYGNDWRTANPKNARETYRCLFSSILPYSVYMETIGKEHMISSSFIETNRRYINKYEHFKEMAERENEGWNKTMFAAGERFRLWKKYMPLKGQLERLMEEKRYDEAELILKDYINVLQKGMKIGIVICFSSDFLDYVKQIYTINGQNDKVEFIEKNVLPEDLKPIDI